MEFCKKEDLVFKRKKNKEEKGKNSLLWVWICDLSAFVTRKKKIQKGKLKSVKKITEKCTKFDPGRSCNPLKNFILNLI